MSKCLKWFVIGSVALNVLLAGMLFGNMAKSYTSQGDMLLQVIDHSSLPDAKKQAFKNQLEAMDKTDDASRAAMDADREKAQQILTAEKFNREAYLSQLDRMFAGRSVQRRKMFTAMADVAAEMNQQDRIALAEQLRKRSERWKKK